MFLVFWKSLSTNFPFTSNIGTNNEAKRVAYSRLNTQEKENGADVDVEVDLEAGDGEFYRTGSKSSNELSLSGSNQSESVHNNEVKDNRFMKHSVSMDWNGKGSLIQRHTMSTCSSSWRRKIESSEGDDCGFDEEKQIEVENDKDKDFEVQSHSKFMSGIIFNDELSDADEDDKAFICDVCDRSFPSAKRLSAHQDKKRHFGCLQCDSIFTSRETLELHREQMNHFDQVSDCGSETTSFDSDEEDLLENDEDNQKLDGESGMNITSPASLSGKFQFFKRA